MEKKFIEIFSEIIESQQLVHLEDVFADLDQWDSLAALSIVSMIDDEYGLLISSRDFEKMATVEDVLNFIKINME